MVSLEKKMKAAIIYWTKSGNTEKVATAIRDALGSFFDEVAYLNVKDAGDLDYFDYELICLGFPSYQWRPPKPVEDFLKDHHKRYGKEDRIHAGSPKVAGKHVMIFCTYSGPHTGINEAIPAAKYAAQFFEHIGFTVLDELYVVGEFHGWEEGSTAGRLGDIRGRPNEKDLAEVRKRVGKLVKRL
jgi:flavodoxin